MEQTKPFCLESAQRQNCPAICRLMEEFEAKHQAIQHQLFARLGSRLSELDKKHIKDAFYLFQNKVLGGPINALADATTQEQPSSTRHSLLEALCRLFQLQRDESSCQSPPG
jgi:glutamyl-tRNA reductase